METFQDYIAFISYRHTPLDKQAARRVQRSIERYTVPKEFRTQVGGIRLGKVFRDEDELPASSNLSESITQALDRSQFLIVICTPDLPKSHWCEEEIRYFLKTHDRDHLLAVLVDGEPGESFSPYMLQTFDEEGNFTGRTEPLAANIAGKKHTINNKTYRKEIIRILAAMIGCPFDDLWQRDRRARANSRAAVIGACALVMACFAMVVMLKNRQITRKNEQILEQNEQITEQNTQITEQNEQILEQNEFISEQNEQITQQNDELTTQKKELEKRMSSALVDTGLAKLESWKVKEAILDALQAAENMDPDVLDPRVEKLLADAVGAYQVEQISNTVVFEQPTDILDLQVTDDQKSVIIQDMYGVLKRLDVETWTVQWEIDTKDVWTQLYVHNLGDRLLYKTSGQVCCVSAKDGSEIWSYTYLRDSTNYFQAISDDGNVFVILVGLDEERGTLVGHGPWYLLFLDTQTGEEMGIVSLVDEEYRESYFSQNKKEEFATGFSSDGRYFLCSYPVENLDPQAADQKLTLFYAVDMETWERIDLAAMRYRPDFFYGITASEGLDQFWFSLHYTRYGGISSILATMQDDGYTFDELIESNDIALADGGTDTKHYGNAPRFHMLTGEKQSIVFTDNRMIIFNRNGNVIRKSYGVEGMIRYARWKDQENNIFEILTSDGWIIDYQLTDLNAPTVLSALQGDTIHQDGILFGEPLQGGLYTYTQGSGFVVHKEGGFLSVRKDAPGQILLSAYRTDSDVKDLQMRDQHFRTPRTFQFIPDSDLAVFFYFEDACYAVIFNWSTGEVVKKVKYDENLYWKDIQVVDENHFLYKYVLFSFDGTKEEYGSPYITEDGREYSTYYYKEHVRLGDGSILTFGQKIQILDHNIGDQDSCSTILTWIDGEPVEEVIYAGLTQLAYYDETMLEVFGGSSGCIAIRSTILDQTENGFETDGSIYYQFFKPQTGEKVRIPDPNPDCTGAKVAIGNQSRMMAVAYEDGSLYFCGADSDTIVQIESSYAEDGVDAISFSEEDAYLLVMTSTGQLDIYRTDTLEKVFSDQISLIKQKIDEGYNVGRNVQFLNRISADQLSDGEHLLVSVSDDGDINCSILISCVDWAIKAEIGDVLAWDPEQETIYKWNNGELYQFALYDLETLKGKALTMLEEQD